ncbi:uncharacterized protein LOC134281435 isoform X2 [Saccostrea cucullata]|uniref:uncharacterized protein LOC134281435 isoform X2 n=1 Tax=Saccostrea cuccullata TaxID=36930 RepID=UPI002ED2EBED
MYINSRLSSSMYTSADRTRNMYENMNGMSEMDALYGNEDLYTDISQIKSSKVNESSLTRSRSTQNSEDIQERLNYFDTESRITVSSDATIHVFKLRKNDRYSFEKRFTKNCDKPQGICVASSKVYVCEPRKNEVIEYTIRRNGTGQVLNKYGKGVLFLKQPSYVSVETGGSKIRLLISDKELGLKRVVLSERESNTSGWKSPKGEYFTPSKPCVCKNNVVVGNSTGQKLHFVNFQTRMLSHKEYEIENIFHSPVALAFESNQGYLIMACKDGHVVIYRTVDQVEMYEIIPEVKNDDPVYVNHYFPM